jgi:hypothetical protein
MHDRASQPQEDEVAAAKRNDVPADAAGPSSMFLRIEDKASQVAGQGESG